MILAVLAALASSTVSQATSPDLHLHFDHPMKEFPQDFNIRDYGNHPEWNTLSVRKGACSLFYGQRMAINGSYHRTYGTDFANFCFDLESGNITSQRPSYPPSLSPVAAHEMAPMFPLAEDYKNSVDDLVQITKFCAQPRPLPPLNQPGVPELEIVVSYLESVQKDIQKLVL